MVSIARSALKKKKDITHPHRKHFWFPRRKGNFEQTLQAYQKQNMVGQLDYPL